MGMLKQILRPDRAGGAGVPSIFCPSKKILCVSLNFSSSSTDEKVISRETALHDNIAAGTCAAHAASTRACDMTLVGVRYTGVCPRLPLTALGKGRSTSAVHTHTHEWLTTSAHRVADNMCSGFLSALNYPCAIQDGS